MIHFLKFIASGRRVKSKRREEKHIAIALLSVRDICSNNPDDIIMLNMLRNLKEGNIRLETQRVATTKVLVTSR